MTSNHTMNPLLTNLPMADMGGAVSGDSVTISMQDVTATGTLIWEVSPTGPVEIRLDGTDQRVWVPRNLVERG